MPTLPTFLCLGFQQKSIVIEHEQNLQIVFAEKLKDLNLQTQLFILKQVLNFALIFQMSSEERLFSCKLG